jgi:iron-sulfur cluster assembly protein
MSTALTPKVTLTPKAALKVRDLLAQKKRDDLALRIYVAAGGCRGYTYGMAWDTPAEDDAIIEQDGVRVLIDPLSAPYLDGAEVDFAEALMGGGFTITNPNAVSTCGCGQSFKSKDGGGAPSPCGCGH